MSDIFKNALLGIETSNFEFALLTSGDHVVEVLLNGEMRELHCLFLSSTCEISLTDKLAATTRRDAKDNVIGVVGIGE